MGRLLLILGADSSSRSHHWWPLVDGTTFITLCCRARRGWQTRLSPLLHHLNQHTIGSAFCSLIFSISSRSNCSRRAKRGWQIKPGGLVYQSIKSYPLCLGPLLFSPPVALEADQGLGHVMTGPESNNSFAPRMVREPR